MRVFVVLLVVSVLTSPAVSAQTFYKCPQKNGSIAYVQEPCGPKAAKVEVIQQSPAEVARSEQALYAFREREYENKRAKSRAAAAFLERDNERIRQTQRSLSIINNAQLQEQNAALIADRDAAVDDARTQAAQAHAEAQAAQSRAASVRAQSMAPTFNPSTRQWCTTEGGFTSCH